MEYSDPRFRKNVPQNYKKNAKYKRYNEDTCLLVPSSGELRTLHTFSRLYLNTYYEERSWHAFAEKDALTVWEVILYFFQFIKYTQIQQNVSIYKQINQEK